MKRPQATSRVWWAISEDRWTALEVTVTVLPTVLRTLPAHLPLHASHKRKPMTHTQQDPQIFGVKCSYEGVNLTHHSLAHNGVYPVLRRHLSGVYAAPRRRLADA